MANKSELLLAAELLKIKAVKLQPEQPFTWASGWKSPIYCDNRKTLSFPEIRTIIKDCFVKLIRENFPQAEAIVGVATGGIPQGALVADELGLPFLYVRSAPKDHGLENLVEGDLKPGQKIVVIEDLVSTGGSSLKAVKALRSAQADVLGMLAIFTYGFPVAEQKFAEDDVKLMTLSNYTAVLQHLLETNKIGEAELEVLKSWRENPGEWGK